MSLVGPTFGPETQTYGGYHQRAAAAPKQPVTCEYMDVESFTSSPDASADSICAKANSLVGWVKAKDQSAEDTNAEANAVETNESTSNSGMFSSKVEVKVTKTDDGMVINRINTSHDGSQFAEHLEISHGNIHGMSLSRPSSGYGAVEGFEFTGTAGFDGLNKRSIEGNAAKGEYAKICIDLLQLG